MFFENVDCSGLPHPEKILFAGTELCGKVGDDLAGAKRPGQDGKCKKQRETESHDVSPGFASRWSITFQKKPADTRCYTAPLHSKGTAMTNKKQLPAQQPAEAPTGRAANPFLNAEFYNRMRDYTERDAAFSKELKAIAESGAGKQSTDMRTAPSLQLLRAVVKKGLSLDAMLGRIVEGVELGLWEPWLSAFGIEIRRVNYAKPGQRNARLALDMSLACKVNSVFANAGVANWRSLVAEDCVQIQIDKPTEKNGAKVYAIFYLDAPGK
jgi:hypothetical protein